jgi:glycine C-acetyltransferase
MNLIFDLRENYHVFVSGVVYPVVPRGELLLRLIPTAVHTDEDVDTTLQAFESVRPKLLNGEYNREPYVFSIVGKS